MTVHEGGQSVRGMCFRLVVATALTTLGAVSMSVGVGLGLGARGVFHCSFVPIEG
jgi:hypothetical protein